VALSVGLAPAQALPGNLSKEPGLSSTEFANSDSAAIARPMAHDIMKYNRFETLTDPFGGLTRHSSRTLSRFIAVARVCTCGTRHGDQ
jgi:hypothetical protein